MSDVTLNVRGEKFPARLPTKDEQIDAWVKLAYDLNFHRSISLRSADADRILAGLDQWVQAQREYAGERQEVRDERVGRAFWDYVARCDVPRSTRGRPKKNVEE